MNNRNEVSGLSRTQFLPPPLPTERTVLGLAPEYARWQAEEPVVRVRLPDGNQPWLVTRYADARAVLAHPAFSADGTRPGFPGTRAKVRPRGPGQFQLMDAPDHTRLRRALIPEFGHRRIQGLRDQLQRIADELIDTMTADGATNADLVAAYALPIPMLAICRLLGVPYEDSAFFETKYRVVTSLDTEPAEALAAREELYAYLGDLLALRREDPADDLISRLAARTEITPEESVGMLSLLLAAGHDTTANMLSMAVISLLHDPDGLAALQADPARWPAAVEELLRQLSVIHAGLRRVAVEDTEIGGTPIRAGDGVVVSLQIANRDPAAFRGVTHELDLARDAGHHLAFGHGPHQCIGQSLARLELHAGLATLFRRLPDLRLAAPVEGLELSRSAVHGVRTLPVSW
ncbi:cytochrome P450 [Streptomyces sp. NPDC004539]|uniref:cytochrome P450 n=1 Tax=Streptomyces sp. NPDC004539 TaxID=3154280 RepID=UPI0033BC72AD